MTNLFVALIAAGPAGLTGWAAYLAARRGAARDIASDRAEVLRVARERAGAADIEREATRAKLLSLETQFDRLRAVVRRLVDALDTLEPDHILAIEAREVLDDIAED